MEKKFGYEVDYIAIGDKSKSGDAIGIRWGYDLDKSNAEQFVMLIDGGHKCSAGDVVRHIKKYYYGDEDIEKEKAIVDLVINTHPHSDHLAGLPVIYEQLVIQELWMHRPWDHAGLPKWFDDGRVTDKSIKEQLKDGLEDAYKLSKSYQKDTGLDTVEPFSGLTAKLKYGVTLYVLGPTRSFYERLLPDFNSTPTNGTGVGKKRIILDPDENDVEASNNDLTDEGDTSAENQSSVVLVLKMQNEDLLMFTGDAGINSLQNAMDQFDKFALDISKLTLFHVPHHGSLQNMGKTIVKRIFGSPIEPKQTKAVTARISVAAQPEYGHPSRRVINALLRVGCKVFETHGMSKQFHKGSALLHSGWSNVESLQPYEKVEGVSYDK